MKKRFLRFLSLVMATVTMMSLFAIDTAAAKTNDELGTPKVSISLLTTPAIKLSWGEVDGADMYYVYRRDTSKGSLKLYAKTEKLYYKDTEVKEYGKYYYKVKAVSINQKGKVTKRSACSSMVTKTVVNLKAPKVTAKTVSDSKINLSWNAVDGADRYYLYVASSKNGKYNGIGYTTDTSYTFGSLRHASTYYFKVKSGKVVEGKVSKSDYSKVISAKTKSRSGEVLVNFEKITNKEVGLPTGSAMTGLAMLMQFYSDKKVDPNDLVPYFNCSTNFYKKDGELYGPDPSMQFVGDPTSTKAYGNGTDVTCIGRVWEKYSDNVYGKCIGKYLDTLPTYEPDKVREFLDKGNILLISLCMYPNSKSFYWITEDNVVTFRKEAYKYVILCGYTNSGECIVYDPANDKYEYYTLAPETYNTINTYFGIVNN